MPLGASLAMLLGPVLMHLGSTDDDWQLLWRVLAAVAVLLVLRRTPSGSAFAPGALKAAGQKAISKDRQLPGLALRSRLAWWLALSFLVYSGQWIAIVGFLPSSYA